jgi:putative endonuclease
MRRALSRALAALGAGKHFNREVGTLGEHLAERHLWRRGHRILARNWRSRLGEIDLVSALPDGTIVFTEVKTRRGEEHGEPLEAIDDDKHRRLMMLADDYLRRWRLERRPVRFDLIGIVCPPGGGPPELEHIEGMI